jgi:hypothetical protein
LPRARLLPLVRDGVLAAAGFSGAAHADRDTITLALTYCSVHRHGVKLKDDGRILCFDDRIRRDMNLDDFRRLADDGTFVVRSMGGDVLTAMAAANILLEKNATVVVRDYCLSACASAFFVGGNATFVAKDAVVAWHTADWKSWLQRINCPAWDTRAWTFADGAARKKQLEQLAIWCKFAEYYYSFFKIRKISYRFTRYPQTAHTMKMFNLIVGQGTDENRVFWTWNPTNHKGYFNNRITYDSYPESQDEVDEIMRRAGFRFRVIYDPEE